MRAETVCLRRDVLAIVLSCEVWIKQLRNLKHKQTECIIKRGKYELLSRDLISAFKQG